MNGNAPSRSSESWDKFIWSAGGRYVVNEMVAVYANGAAVLHRLALNPAVVQS